jgi:hypothetical protein
MGDMGDHWREHREYERNRKISNHEKALMQKADEDAQIRRHADNKKAERKGWTVHTDYHWSRTLNCKRLDYWPSRNKFMYEGRVMCGDVMGFIRKREKAQVVQS